MRTGTSTVRTVSCTGRMTTVTVALVALIHCRFIGRESSMEPVTVSVAPLMFSRRPGWIRSTVSTTLFRPATVT